MSFVSNANDKKEIDNLAKPVLALFEENKINSVASKALENSSIRQSIFWLFKRSGQVPLSGVNIRTRHRRYIHITLVCIKVRPPASINLLGIL